MKCPKCGFTSFPYLESCHKCGLVLAEPQAAMGLYALRPDPPDLLLAYQTANLDIARMPPVLSASMPGIDLGSLEKLEIAQAPEESAEPASPTPDMLPTLAQEVTPAVELPPLEPRVEPLGSAETVRPHTLDPSELADMTPDLDNTMDLGDKSARSFQLPKDSPEEQPVYDLDLDDDLAELSLGPLEDESSTADPDDGEEVVEYTLEIEDNLEFEIEDLELEQDDETEGEDDDES
jgi:hypothetical protein